MCYGVYLSALHGGGLAVEDEHRLDARLHHVDRAVEHALHVTAHRARHERREQQWNIRLALIPNSGVPSGHPFRTAVPTPL